MPPDHRARAGAIDVNIAGDQLRFGPLDVGRTAREKARRKGVVGAVCDLDRFVEIAHFDHARTGPKISSRAIRAVGFTSVKMVGGMKYPSFGTSFAW